MKQTSFSFSAFCKKLLKIFISLFFILLAGLLFWQGFDSIFMGIDLGLPIKDVLLKGIFMLVINLVGALFCLLYALMPAFPYIFSLMNKDNEES
jgi:TRAP-type C4-dicarboxylate transport system permease small subunit